MSILSHPIKKLTILGIFAGGYVLGAKAGRERYEQILQAAGQVKEDPRVKEATARAEDLVRETATKVTEDPRVKDAAARAQEAVREATGNTATGNTGGTPTDTVRTNAGGQTHPLLADPHIDAEDEVVYSTGPDIEETVEQQRPKRH
ncbi:hypothetical protein [Aeromicrobium sp.]|uniref:hypothetical protein n=1 Tax=Aeromicrobium sp. TaxID=1871063 RepID=UPI0030BBE532